MNALKKLSILCLGGIFGFSLAQAQQYEENALYVKLKESAKISTKSLGERRVVPLSSLGLKLSKAKSDQFGLHQEAYSMHLFGNPVLEKSFRIQFDSTSKIDKLIRMLENDPAVEFVERVSVGHIYSIDPKAVSTDFDSIPDDPYFQPIENGAKPLWYLDMINAPGAWHMQKGDSNLIVAVVDGAVWGEHPELQIPSAHQYSVYSGVNNSAPPAGTDQDELCEVLGEDANGNDLCPSYTWSHGTHCAGVVAAKTNNGEGMASLASGVTLLGVAAHHPQYPGVVYRGYDGITWAADNGARVISCSWGGGNETIENEVLKTCYENNIVILGAAGNEGANNAIFPGASPYAISVGSVDENGSRSSFSNYGIWVDIVAPGGNSTSANGRTPILSTTYCYPQYMRLYYPDIYASGFENQRYDLMQGTSMATPLVASLCALMISRDSTLTPDQIRDLLQISSHKSASLAKDFSPLVGYIDAAAAIKAVDEARFDEPVSNLRITDHIIDTVWIEWDAPKNPQHKIASYNVFRNGELLDSLVSPDATSYMAVGGRGGMTSFMVSVNYEDGYKSCRIETLQELPNIYTVTIVCRPGQGGTVLGAGNYEVNDYAYLEAFPNPGYKFVRWYSGKVLSTHETCEVVVKDDMTVNAIFEEISANENDLANAIGLAPNPVSDVLNVSAPFAIEKIFVYDYQGRAIQVFEGKGQTEMTLDLESLAQGNYILNIQTLQGNVQKKIVKL